MATQTLPAILAQPCDSFTSVPFYESTTDSLIIYFRDVRSYGHRVSKYFTLFLAIDDDSLVGMEVKGMSVLERAIETEEFQSLLKKPLACKLENGKSIELEVLIRFAANLGVEDDITTERLRELREKTEGMRVPNFA